MKGMKGKFAKKLKSIKTIDYLKPPEKILYVGAALDDFIDKFPLKPNLILTPNFLISKGQDPPPQKAISQGGSFLVTSLNDIKDQYSASPNHSKYQENVRPSISVSDSPLCCCSRSQEIDSDNGDDREQPPPCEIDPLSFRRPDMDYGTLFDPNLLAAFQQAVAQVKARNLASDHSTREEPQPQLGSHKAGQLADTLMDFEHRCPPGRGIDSVIVYTTSLRGIRKTFEDCQSIRFLLESFRILFRERDISIHSEFREELWGVMGEKLVPPRLFIKGRYIGGAEEVLGLHERGMLLPLFDGMPLDSGNGPCQRCHGLRFVMCFNCCGSRKVFDEHDQGQRRCPYCNENGLIVCPLCC